MRSTLKHWLIVPLILLAAACDTTPQADKYPFPVQFVSPSDVSPRVLEAPYPPFSAEYNKEIDSIIARQAKLTEAEKDAIKSEDHITPAMIVLPVIGPEYTEAKFPALYTLLRHASSDAWRDGDAAQEYWNRTRPWIADRRVALLVSSIERPSYPSGHSTTNHVWAHVLTDIFPEKHEALFARAYEIGMHRSDAGVHYPSDVAAGKKFAAYLYDKMHKTPKYQAELAAAQAEVNAAIAAAAPPPPPPPPPAPKPIPNPEITLPQGNVPVDCMHPKPGEVQTGCR